MLRHAFAVVLNSILTVATVTRGRQRLEGQQVVGVCRGEGKKWPISSLNRASVRRTPRA